MALDGAMKLGGAYVEITARMDKLNADLAEVKARASGLGSVFSGANVAIAGAIGGMVAAFKAASNAIREYASLEAATQTATAVFGDSAKKVTDEADNMARAFGNVKSAYLDSSNIMGMYIKNMQYTADQAANLSMGVNQLAGDLAAAFDKPFDQAAQALLSAFQGNSQPMIQFGVTLSAAKVEMEAMRLGFVKLNGEFTPTAKMFSTLSIIMRETKDAQGAMVRESDQLSSQLKKASGSIVNMAADLGGSLAPAVQGFLGMMGDLGSQFSWIWTGMLDSVKEFASGLGDYFSGIALIARNFGDVFQIARLKIYEFGMNVGEVMATVPENLGRVGEWIANNWRELIVDGLNAVWTAFKNLSSNIGELVREIWEFLSDPINSEWNPNFTPLLDGFKATVGQFPELVKAELSSVEDELAKVGQRINDREGSFAAAKAGKIEVAPLDLNLKEAKQADEAMKRMMGGIRKVEVTEGASNFAKKIQESLMGGGAQQIQQQQLDQQKKIADAGEKTAEAVQKLAEGGGGAGAVLG